MTTTTTDQRTAVMCDGEVVMVLASNAAAHAWIAEHAWDCFSYRTVPVWTKSA